MGMGTAECCVYAVMGLRNDLVGNAATALLWCFDAPLAPRASTRSDKVDKYGVCVVIVFAVSGARVSMGCADSNQFVKPEYYQPLDFHFCERWHDDGLIDLNKEATSSSSERERHIRCFRGI